jgi:linoleoyl-CoA desaturase
MSASPYPMHKVKFPRPEAISFSKTLKARVNQYFKDNSINPKANGAMLLKTIMMLSMYFGPYLFLLFFSPGPWAVVGLFAIMGFGMSGIGMSVMHDAAHGAYHRSPKVNDFIASSIYLISGNLTNWRLQHNVLHHTYTNIDGLDDDLDTHGLLRLHPDQPYKKKHKFQLLYAPFLYAILTLNWVTMKDFAQLRRYQKTGVAKLKKDELRKEWIKLVYTKALYFTLFLVIPLIFITTSWYIILIGFILMHLIAGFVLSFVFQLAHVVDHVKIAHLPVEEKPEPMEDAFLEHQLATTSDFAQRSKIIGWYLGGLNFQVEHHLFPHICHVHYPEISKIVKNTAKEFGLPYYEHKTLMQAIRAHLRSLKFYSTMSSVSPKAQS